VIFLIFFIITSSPPWEKALRELSLERDELPINLLEMDFYGGGGERSHLFTFLMKNPLRVDPYTSYLFEAASYSSHSIYKTLLFASSLIGLAVRRGLIEDPVSKREKELDPVAPLIKELKEMKAELSHEEEKRISLLPLLLRKKVALFLKTAKDVLQWRRLAFRNTKVDSLLPLLIPYVVGEENESGAPLFRLVEEEAEKIDLFYLSAGASELSLLADNLMDAFDTLKVGEFEKIDLLTDLGRIVILDKGNDTIDLGGVLLLIDLGGDDLYLSRGKGDFSPLTFLVDIEGNDRYIGESFGTPSFGGGMLGYSFLLDIKGNDIYSSKNITQGAGMMGFGVLVDKRGDDKYESYVGAQGSGFWGVGILIDLEGDDSYYSYQQAQGFGYVKGAGLLLDCSGNDKYLAEDKDIRFPSSQTKEHNTSLCQGTALGKRADFTDGHSLPGGVGALVDLEGNDSYSAGVFCQGCGYWYGVGLLLDGKGDDRYHGVWYAQGSAAHFAIGILRDKEGDDVYEAERNMAQGAGHDFSMGVLIEDKGNDKYYAPNLSLGSGNANGMGIFIEKDGDDFYYPKGKVSLGMANLSLRGPSLRKNIKTLGIFFDCGGDDHYSEEFQGDGKVWKRIEGKLMGIGIDLSERRY